jgi:hypothetical protein
MKAQKWNYKTHDYDPYELPENCRLYETDLSLKVACCHCGKEYEFGVMYTSREIHNNMGFGYPVCKACFNIEIEKSKQK